MKQTNLASDFSESEARTGENASVVESQLLGPGGAMPPLSWLRNIQDDDYSTCFKTEV